jgi:phosphatidylinositol alpha-1,6-mannosyltransferase
MPPPTTLLVSDNFPPWTGGSGRWFWEVYRRLERERYAVAAGEHPRQAEFDRTHDLRLHRLPLRLNTWGLLSLAGLRGYWRSVRALRGVIRAENVRALQCGRCLPEGWMAWLLRRRLGIPYACYVHGEEMNYAASSRELSWMMRRVLSDADFFIANSRNTERILREGWGLPANRIHVLHPGVDTGRFRPAPADPAVRQRLGWQGRRVLLTVGRLQKRKGHDQMTLALPAILRDVPDVLYAVVGDGEEREPLRALVAREGLEDRVQFLGELDDAGLLECYQQCDLFVLPNRQIGEDIEGFGMVLLEAQACGKPVVAGASGGTAETMCIPETGMVVPCDGPADLARVAVELLSDRERLARMGEAGRRWVVGQFDWEPLSRRARCLFEGGSSCEDRPAGKEVLAEASR